MKAIRLGSNSDASKTSRTARTSSRTPRTARTQAKMEGRSSPLIFILKLHLILHLILLNTFTKDLSSIYRLRNLLKPSPCSKATSSLYESQQKKGGHRLHYWAASQRPQTAGWRSDKGQSRPTFGLRDLSSLFSLIVESVS
jgi:hypothetical protein